MAMLVVSAFCLLCLVWSSMRWRPFLSFWFCVGFGICYGYVYGHGYCLGMVTAGSTAFCSRFLFYVGLPCIDSVLVWILVLVLVLTLVLIGVVLVVLVLVRALVNGTEYAICSDGGMGPGVGIDALCGVGFGILRMKWFVSWFWSWS